MLLNVGSALPGPDLARDSLLALLPGCLGIGVGGRRAQVFAHIGGDCRVDCAELPMHAGDVRERPRGRVPPRPAPASRRSDGAIWIHRASDAVSSEPPDSVPVIETVPGSSTFLMLIVIRGGGVNCGVATASGVLVIACTLRMTE